MHYFTLIGNFLKKIRSWFIFAKRVWIALGLGWLALVVGFTPLLRLDRGGALLICGVIIAEVFHDKRHRLFINQVLPGFSTSYKYREVDMIEENYKGIEITPHQIRSDKHIVNADRWTLYQLANPNEFWADDGSRRWDLNRTLKRVETRVEWSIVFSAVIGTISWAFG